MDTRARMRWRSGASQGFTLIELLVVVTVVIGLAALLLPALSQGKSRAQSVACLSNLKQLQLCWHLYTDDFDGVLPPNNVAYAISGDLAIDELSWCPGNVRTDPTTTNIERGKLFPYNSSTAIYRCPSDHSTVTAEDGSSTGIPRTRSYNMSISIHCDVASSFHLYSEIHEPNPEQLFVFTEPHQDSILDSTFGIYSTNTAVGNIWVDLPADRHEQGISLSFADGHVEHWRWASPKIFERWGQEPINDGDWRDLRRLQECIHP